MMPLNAYSKSIAKSKIAKFDSVNADQVDVFLSKLDDYNNKRLYASYIQKFFNINQKETFFIINSLLDSNIIDPRFQIKVGDRFLSGEFKKLSDVPETIFDEENGHDISIKYKDNIFVFYRVNV